MPARDTSKVFSLTAACEEICPWAVSCAMEGRDRRHARHLLQGCSRPSWRRRLMLHTLPFTPQLTAK